MAGFSVDTHVFRELGELLVGRDSTALVELIKNSYDADAREVVVYGERLDSVETGLIRVSDDGVGMNQGEFQDGFLRIASRTKEEGPRLSPRFKRRYTGAKGIGRLAAHKLARVLEIESFPAERAAAGGVRATIDWDAIERHQTLDEVKDLNVEVVPVPPSLLALGGTTITLRKLRRKWSKEEHGRFLEEVQNFEAARILVEPLPPHVVSGPLLFESVRVRDAVDRTPFAVKLEGDLAPPDDYWVAALEATNWILEIDANRQTGKVSYAISPTEQTAQEIGEGGVSRFEKDHPRPEAGPFFQARILIRTGQVRGGRDIKAWSGRAYGVRVFMEGFRVLPYGEPKNDWLGLDRDYAERSKDLLREDVANPIFPALPKPADRPGLTSLPNKNYFGGVFLTQSDAPGLRMLVNREGFVPDEAFDILEGSIRTGIDLATRVRAAATFKTREDERRQRAVARAVTGVSPDAPPLSTALERAETHASAARRYAAAGDARRAVGELEEVLAGVGAVKAQTQEVADQAAMLRVLASVGTQLSSFVHELNGLLGMAEAVEAILTKLVDELSELKRAERARLREATARVADLRRHLERHASYLIDVVTPDVRRRRSRQRLFDRFASAMRLVDSAATRRGIRIDNQIPPDLKSLPMFAAELTAIFANLLTNAVKAAGQGGQIRASARTSNGATVIRIENTGNRVKVSESERWFRPFESSTTDVDQVLGQGMGLGLTITRRILEEYGAAIKFVAPSASFATAIEITFHG